MNELIEFLENRKEYLWMRMTAGYQGKELDPEYYILVGQYQSTIGVLTKIEKLEN